MMLIDLLVEQALTGRHLYVYLDLVELAEEVLQLILEVLDNIWTQSCPKALDLAQRSYITKDALR